MNEEQWQREERKRIGKLIERRLDDFKWTKKDLADKAGLYREQVSLICHGHKAIPEHHVKAVASTLRLREGELVPRPMPALYIAPSLEPLYLETRRVPYIRYVGAPETQHQFIKVPAAMAPEGAFCIRVRGSAMDLAGILDGDLAILVAEGTPRVSDIVAVEEWGAWELRRLKYVNGALALAPESREEHPAFVAAEKKMHGLLTGTLRCYHAPLKPLEGPKGTLR